MPFVVIALVWALLGETVHAYHVVGAGHAPSTASKSSTSALAATRFGAAGWRRPSGTAG